MAVWDVAVCRASMCVLRKAWGPPLGGVMRGRLRRPCRPLQVIGVLAVVLPIARKSLQFSPSAERAVGCQYRLRPIAKSGERLHAKMGLFF